MLATSTNPPEARETLHRHPVLSRADKRIVDGRIGSLHAQIAREESHIEQILRLRHQVFRSDPDHNGLEYQMDAAIDQDLFDAYCDHVMVRSDALPEEQNIVGTYRLLRQEIAEQNQGFYSQSEFEIGPLLDRHPGKNFLELGRSCVLEDYRSKRTIELLWHGTWAYVLHHGIDVMFGCASFKGTDPGNLGEPLSLLYHYHRTDAEWCVKANKDNGLEMNMVAREDIDVRKSLRALPPLIKGYLRLGAKVAPQAYIDHSFGTIDVLIVLPVKSISEKYIRYYGHEAQRHREHTQRV